MKSDIRPGTTQYTIERVDPGDTALIRLLAGWYLNEWAIPAERTEERLRNFPRDGFPFHLVLKEQGQPVATGGLYNEVSLHHFYPEYKKVGPWIALLYTIPEKRGRGTGAFLCEHLEQIAMSQGFDEVYLYTYTAEPLYLRLNYQPIERLNYRGNEEVVMKKTIRVP